MKLNTALADSATDWMKSSAESVWDLIPKECGPLPTCGANTTVPECSDLLLNVEDDVRDDSISVDHRRSKSLLDVEASVESRERKEPRNDISSIAAIRDPVCEEVMPPTVQKKINAPVSPRPKNLPIGRFRKKAAAAPIRYPTPENAVIISDKRSTLSPFDAAARSNASWQQKMAAMQAMKLQTRAATATEQSNQNEKTDEAHMEERQEASSAPQATEEHQDQSITPKVQKTKTESIKEAKQEESLKKNKQPRSIMKSTNSARREEKVKFHQEPSSKASNSETKESKEIEKQSNVEEKVEEKQKDDYDSVSSLEDPLEEPQGIILNLNQLQNLKNPDYHPVGEPKVIRQIPQQNKKTKKPIFGFLKRRKNDEEIMGRAYK